MLVFILSFTLFFFTALCVYYAVKSIFNFLKEGDNLKAIILIVILVLGIILDFSKGKYFGYSYNFIASKIFTIGIFSFILVLLDDNVKKIRLFSSIYLFLAISVCIYLFSGMKLVNIVYDEVPKAIESHFNEKVIKKEALKYDTKSELKIVLEKLNKQKKEINAQNINDTIEELGYKKYNGIFCYAVDIEKDNYYIGMAYGDTEKIFEPKTFTKKFNYHVDKNTLKIVE